MPLITLPIGPADSAEILRFDGDAAVAARQRLAVLRRFNELLDADPGLRSLSDAELAERQRYYLLYARREVLFGTNEPALAAD